MGNFPVRRGPLPRGRAGGELWACGATGVRSRTCVLAASERPEWLRAAVCRLVRAPSVADARVRSGCVLPCPVAEGEAPSAEEARQGSAPNAEFPQAVPLCWDLEKFSETFGVAACCRCGVRAPSVAAGR